jgi:hypothetical protein
MTARNQCSAESWDARFVNCEACQTEGRILTNDGGPDDVDHGVCPACNGEFAVEVETSPIEIDDLPDYACENCIGMIEHGCYCMAVGCVAPCTLAEDKTND